MKMLKMALLCSLLSGAGGALAADRVTLKIAHFLPSTSNAQSNIIEPWCAQLGEESLGFKSG